MGSITSRQHASVDHAEASAFSQYRYPPKSGNYFGPYFIMGGEKFETPQPEAFLFGENNDLNFLSNRPAFFPYPLAQSNEPTRAIHCLLNVRKESLRFVPAPSIDDDDYKKHNIEANSTIAKKLSTFNIEFTFDSDVDCHISIHYFCTEEITASSVILHSRDSSINSDIYHYQKGANQVFCQMTHVFDPSKYSTEDLTYNTDKEIIPVAIFCATSQDFNGFKQFQTTIAIIEKRTDGIYDLKALKQKNFIDGVYYLLQEIYGIENKKNIESKLQDDDEIEDNGSECVICMCEFRDTLILPCRHLCLCNKCAESLRYQSNNCPICRSPFRALLNINALKKSSNASQANDNIPEGYESIPLMEALNGPLIPKSNSKAINYETEPQDNDLSNYDNDNNSIRAQAIYPSIDRVKRGKVVTTKRPKKSTSNYTRTSDSVISELVSKYIPFDNDNNFETGEDDQDQLEISKNFVRNLSIRSNKEMKTLRRDNNDFKAITNSESQPVIINEDLFANTSMHNSPNRQLMNSMPDTPSSYFSSRNSNQ